MSQHLGLKLAVSQAYFVSGLLSVFICTSLYCCSLQELKEKGFLVDCLHGDRPQDERTEIFRNFREGKLRLLVATEVAARGLDVDDIRVVVNYDMSGGNKPGHPENVDSYVHRIGRTARGAHKLVHRW